MKTKSRGARKFFRVILIVVLLLVLVILLLGMAFSIYVDKFMEKEIDESLFSMMGNGSSSEVYYYDYQNGRNQQGTAIKLANEELFGGYRCVYVEYKDIPQNMIDAFVSIEDKRFFSHGGVDWKRTAGASLNYFLNFNGNFGGSTITQQLIKNITDNDEYSFQRKIQEILWALDLETKMDKSEILESYLNIINLSHGCYGVGIASEYYFSKNISELTLNECACIAAITNNPSYYDPINKPENNKKRKNIILQEMLAQGYIEESEFDEAYNQDIVLNVNSDFDNNSVSSWYVDMVIEDVIDDLIEELECSRAAANLMIYTGGLKIYTAMNIEIQKILEKYYSDESNFYSNNDSEKPQSSMIIICPYTGDILGVAGAIGEKNANRIQNFATDTVRPAGSVIKPLSVYAPALENSLITWSSVYDDVPVNFGKYNLDENKGNIVQPVAWPKNANGIYRGLTNINYALEHSVNTVTVRVLERLGLKTSFDFLYDSLNMKSLIYSGEGANGTNITDMDYAALALGQLNYGVTVREITAAYSIFANDGVYNSPKSYHKVTDSYGNIILSKEYSGKIVISEENADIMTLMLKNVVTNGTATDITLDAYVECAGKTGTTQNNYDKWFIGYTPYFIGGVWYGYEYPKTLNNNVCISVWDDVMTILHKKYISSGEIESFDVSNDLVRAEFCADSGKMATDACRNDPRGNRIESGYFALGTEPKEYCDCHVSVSYDVTSGGVAFADCPDQNVKKIGMITVERNFPIQVYVTDAQYVWKKIPDDILPETSPHLPFFNNILGDNVYCGISKTAAQFNRYCSTHFNYFSWQEKK